MTLCTNDLQTAGCSCLVIQLDIGTTAGHVGSDGNCPMLSGFCDDLRLHLMILCVQHVMTDAASFQHAGKQFTGFDRDGANQDRLTNLVCLTDRIDHGFEFFFLGFIHRILQVFPDHGYVRRDLHNVHAVDAGELVLFCLCSTGHAGLFVIFIKEILECDRCQSFGFSLYFHMLFCFDRLMQTVRITSARHNTSGKLIDDQDLIILDHIILITEHQVMRTQG